MKLLLVGHDDRYALEQLQLSLFPDAPMEYTQVPFSGCDGAVSTLHRGSTWLTATAAITVQGKTARAARRLLAAEETVSRRRQILQQSYFLAARQLLQQTPAWGALAGVRPTKLTSRHLLSGGTPRSAERLLRDTYFVTPERRRLCVDASLATVEAVGRLRSGDLSIYVGIPFCPTRCTYCSFVSQSIARCAGLLEPYLDALIHEIAYTGKLLASSGRHVRTIYIGGGTPTTLSARQMARLLQALQDHLDLSQQIEYTVEGGRPDTLDLEKLRLIRSFGVDRMSINPQSMNDAVLAAVGRVHTAAETIAAYDAARAAGFTSINMDLIAGLPGDTPDSFRQSLEQVLALNPSNITIHTLALKRGADLYSRPEALPSAGSVAAMLEGANSRLREAGFQPYYLYRQKYMSGSFENVGWCRDHDIGLYNIYMMEELHTILSLGGGGMNKLNLPGGKLERFHNPKYPKEYMERLEDVLRQKDAIFAALARR